MDSLWAHGAVTLFGVVGAATSASAWTGAVNLTNSPDYAVGPRAVSDVANNIHLVWYGYGGDWSQWKVYLQSYSGGVWTSPVAVSGSGAAGPDIAVDGSGNLHVVWHAGGNPEEIYYRKRSGGTWGATVNLSNSAGIRSLAPRVAVDSSGNHILVAWHEAGQTGGNWDILARKYTSGVWGGVENVSNDTTLSRTVASVIDAGGNFHMAWEDTDTKNLFYRKRNADGTYGAKIALDTTSGRSYGAALCVAPNGHIHAAWHDANNDWEIVHRQFDGASWGAVTNVSNNPGVVDAGASIAVSATNDVYVIWHDYANVYYGHTVGGVWRPVYRLSRGTTQQTGVILLNGDGTKHALWPSRDPGNWDTLWSWEPTVDTTPPAQVAGLVAQAADGQVTLDWSTPGDADFRGVMIRYKTTGFPTGPTDGTFLADRTESRLNYPDRYVHTGLTNGTTYYYALFTYDYEPNYSAGALVSGTPAPGPKANLLQNPRLDAFSGGVASSWTSYKVNDPNAVINFIADSGTNNFVSVPSQGVTGIDATFMPTTGLSAAGVRQVVSGTTPGKVYHLAGYQDIYNTNWNAVGQRYLLNFGINPWGGTDPGALTLDGTIGGCRWMTSAQACWNNFTNASPVYFSGFHRSTSAFPATGTSVSVWSGVTVNNPAPKDSVATKFNTDDLYLYEWDFPVNSGLMNGDFEGGRLDLLNGGDIIPDGWLPAGGGVGQWNVWRVSNYANEYRSGAWGAQIANRRGVVNAGFMQKIASAPGVSYTFSAWARTTGQDGTTGAVGIDPQGGGDILNPAIVWTTFTASTWTPVSVTATAEGPAVTVFVKTMNNNTDGDAYHHSFFDDCTFVGATPTGTIAGTVVDGCGNAVAEAGVTTSPGGYSTLTAADGTYMLATVPAATYSVTAEKAGFTPATQNGVVVVGGGTATANLALGSPPSGVISGFVRDGGGLPLAGAFVATDVGGYSTTSTLDGSYSMTGMVPGAYAVTVHLIGYESQTASGVVVTDCATTPLDFALAEAPAIAADLDNDGDVDGTDYGTFSGCFNGAGSPVSGGCLAADLNGDQFVDGTDYGIFSACFNGSGNPPACN